MSEHTTVTTDGHAERFTLLRPLLFTIAYEMLGSATEADDVLQESYLRWSEVDLTTVRDTKPYLARLVTRQTLNALRASARRARTTSVRGCRSPCCSRRTTRRLTWCSPSPCPWRCSWSLKHSHPRSARITEQFLTAATTGDLQGLLSLLAKDATFTADGGGKTLAARRPLVGAEMVAARLVHLFHLGRGPSGLRIETVNCNNAPALVAYRDDHLEGVFLIEITNAEISTIYAIRNPDKLLTLTVPRRLSR